MQHIVISEKIHHGDYRNIRHVAVPDLSPETVKAVTDMSPYGGIFSPNQQQRVCQELKAEGKSQIGWSDYGVRKYPAGQGCEYYISCENPAEGVVTSPILIAVPTCQRCADKHKLDLVKFLPVTADPVDLGDKFTLVLADNGDIQHFDGSLDAEEERHFWAVYVPDTKCEHEEKEEDFGPDTCDCVWPDFEVQPGIHYSQSVHYHVKSVEEWTEQDKDVNYVY